MTISEDLLKQTITYRDENYHNDRELIEIEKMISVLECNDDKLSEYYTIYGSEPHQILMNKRVFERAKECGFTSFEFSDYGWIEPNQYEIEKVEEVGFLAPKEKEPNNYFEIGKLPNGKYVHSFYTQTGSAGGASSLHIFNDIFETKEECRLNALDKFKTYFEKAIESSKTDTCGNYKMPYCKQILASINKHFGTINFDIQKVESIIEESKEDKYLSFLKSKVKTHITSGFVVEDAWLNSSLFGFQKFIVSRALADGKYAIFADCGLGKTLMQLNWAQCVMNYTDGPVLILAPLAVVGQTILEGKKFGIDVMQLLPEMYAMDETPKGIYVTNYEQLNNINTDDFQGIVLDESSILKNFEGAIKKDIIESFADTPYKLACTATPSPNDPMELGNHAEFLDVMGRNEMLAMYFVHDGGETAKWRLKGHAVKHFYQFVGTWAIMLNNPSDIGFSMDGYDLPSLNLFENQIVTPKRDNGTLFNDAIISATNFNQELRLTKIERLDEVVRIINEKPEENFIIWIKQNEEGEALKKLIPEAIEVKGSDSDEWKKSKLLGFANNEFRILITKTKIASFGMNYQNCRNQIFASLDFSFEGLYQAIRRSYRFGQTNEVNIYLITTDTMANVLQSIQRKQNQFKIMQEEMSVAINANLQNELLQSASYDVEEVKNEDYQIKRGDCVQLIKDVPDNSIGLSVFSPPFAELYTYSSHVEDMGNSKDYNEFLTQFSYLVKELYRVMMSGRNVAVHCMDLPIQKGKHGFIGLRDFSGLLLKAFEQEGFVYHSRVTIWKDPVVEMQRTKALGLLHKQVKKDSTMSRVGIPDYVMIFRKDGDRENPVTNTELSVDLWQKYASPVWMDINYGNTLQGYRNGRDENDEKHICPLQLDTIERLIHLYSNKGDTVLTPFMGIGSEVFQAVKMNRKGIGFELKESYFDLAKKNLAQLIESKLQQSLFDLVVEENESVLS